MKRLVALVLAQLACADLDDIAQAADAAERGFEVWRRTSAFERYKTMRKAAQLLRDRVEAVARLMTMEQGKPLAEARLEVMAGADTIESPGVAPQGGGIVAGTHKLGTVCPASYPLWSGRRAALANPLHCDLPLLNGYFPFRPPRGTCEVRGSSPNLWLAVVPALGF